jgi:hypothetical protein
VTQKRSFNVVKGLNEITATDIAPKIDPTSVHFKPVSGPAVTVLEQNFDYDLLSAGVLLQKYIGREITLVNNKTGDRQKVTVLSVSRRLIVEKDGIVFSPSDFYMPCSHSIELPDGAGELLISPTLNWQIEAESAGTLEYELSYLTDGLDWRCSYILAVEEDESMAELEGLVTLENECGISFEDATLNLVAGNVRIRKPGQFRTYATIDEDGDWIGEIKDSQIFEYHMYTVPWPTSIQNNQLKQIKLIGAKNVPVRRILTYDGFGANVNLVYEFDNVEENGLGIPLPKGNVRVQRRDRRGGIIELGKDFLDHTPRKETVRLKAGYAPGLQAAVKKSDYDKKRRLRDYEVKFWNRTRRSVEIEYEFGLQPGTWKISNSSLEYERTSVTTAVFKVPVGGGRVSFLRFSVVFPKK